MNNAASLLYGPRSLGPGPKRPKDVTEDFFGFALDKAFQWKARNAQEIVEIRDGRTIEQLISDVGIHKANEIVRDVMFNKEEADRVEPIAPRRKKINGKWGITIGAYWDEPQYEAVIPSVFEIGGQLIGKVTFEEVRASARWTFCRPDIKDIDDVDLEFWHMSGLVLHDFVNNLVDGFKEEIKTG